MSGTSADGIDAALVRFEPRCELVLGRTFAWDPASTYVRKPTYFDGMQMEPAPVTDITGARVLAKLGDSVTTDHISPAGSIKADSTVYNSSREKEEKIASNIK